MKMECGYHVRISGSVAICSVNTVSRIGVVVIVYTGGSFDLFHRGHVRLLKQCRDLEGGSNRVIVSLNTDEFIEQFKGMAPVCSFDERKEVLESCRYVDAVIPNIGATDSKPAILQARPDVVAIGSDWAPPRDYHAQMMFTAEWLEEQQIRLVFLNRTEGVSSSELRDRSTRQQDNLRNTTTS